MSTATLTAEAVAERAAADVAVEAKSETIADVEADRAKRAPRSKPGDPYHRFRVDVWVTNLNSVEFGIYKRARNRAKSRQFTADMDIYAEVIEDGQRTGLLGYRRDTWAGAKGFDKRLVLKLFGEKLNWRATMDMMLARSIQETVGARGLPVTCFAVNTNDHDQVVYVERSANHWLGLPEHFSFFLMDERGLRFYRVKQDILSIGRNYSVWDAAGRQIGLLDGRVLAIGGLWDCKVKREHAEPRLLAVLKLFTGMLVFNTACRKHVRRLHHEIRLGRIEPKLQRQEADLYMNPRRVR
jgi:hypothetical protein